MAATISEPHRLIDDDLPTRLVLRGVRPTDIKDMDAEFEARLSGESALERFAPVPNTFYGFDTWIQSTNLLCRGCYMPFRTQPVFLPTSIEKDADGIRMGVEGLMHSFRCVIRYLELKVRDPIEYRRYYDMVRFLYHLRYGVRMIDIHITASQPVFEMKQYGGKTSIEDWLQNNRDEVPVIDHKPEEHADDVRRDVCSATLSNGISRGPSSEHTM